MENRNNEVTHINNATCLFGYCYYVFLLSVLAYKYFTS